jgi:hypothetical protein
MSLSPKGKKPDGRDDPIPVVIERRKRRTACMCCPQPAVVLHFRGLQIADNFASSSPA